MISTISEFKPRKTITCFGAYLYFAETQHGNLHQLSVTMSRVTYLILRAYTATGVSHSQHRKKHTKTLGRFWKNAGEWTGRVEISKEKSLAAGVACMIVCGSAPG